MEAGRGWGNSNPRPSVLETDALPTELNPYPAGDGLHAIAVGTQGFCWHRRGADTRVRPRRTSVPRVPQLEPRESKLLALAALFAGSLVAFSAPLPGRYRRRASRQMPVLAGRSDGLPAVIQAAEEYRAGDKTPLGRWANAARKRRPPPLSVGMRPSRDGKTLLACTTELNQRHRQSGRTPTGNTEA